MWGEITRAQYRRDGLRYASDTTDAEWAIIAPFMPPPATRGRQRTTDLRAVVNALFYIAQTGCQWRMLPKDFPPFTTVQAYFYPWRTAVRHDSCFTGGPADFGLPRGLVLVEAGFGYLAYA